MSMMDKREYKRVDVALEVTQSSRGRISTARARNLGYGGMQVEVPGGPVAKGDRLGLEFKLPATKVRVLADAEVVYKAAGLVGLRFTYIPQSMRRHLDDYVSTRLEKNWFK